MSRQPTPKSEQYQGYLRLRCQLHRLIARGLIDSPEADQVREELMIPWRELGKEDITEVQLLAEDLHSLEDLPGVETLSVQSPASRGTQLLIAAKQKDWQELLRLLRESKELLPAERIACLRAWAWHELAQPEPGGLFLKGAALQALICCAEAMTIADSQKQLTTGDQQPRHGQATRKGVDAMPVKGKSGFKPAKSSLRQLYSVPNEEKIAC